MNPTSPANQRLRQIAPSDFETQSLNYETTTDGQEMKLYTFGPNQFDDNGFTYRDGNTHPNADDSVIRTRFYDPPVEQNDEME